MRRSRNMIGFMLFSAGYTVISLVFLTITSVLEILPVIVPLLLRALLGLLFLTGRIYALFLHRLSPLTERFLHFSLLHGLGRLAGEVALSEAIGCLLSIWQNWPITQMALFVFAGHAVAVDLLWNEIPEIGEIQIGEDL